MQYLGALDKNNRDCMETIPNKSASRPSQIVACNIWEHQIKIIGIAWKQYKTKGHQRHHKFNNKKKTNKRKKQTDT